MLFACPAAMHPGLAGCGALSMLLRATLDVDPIFQRDSLRYNGIGFNELQECQATFHPGRTAKLRFL
jgi:hypothetical protein